MKSRKAGIHFTSAALVLVASVAIMTGCSATKAKVLSAADSAKLCVQLANDSLNLSQSFTVAAFAHSPTPEELKNLDTQMATLRNDLKKLTPDQRAKLSVMLEAAATARANIAAGKSIDAASISLAQQAFAKVCLPG